jgi:hypothetical protein
MDYRVFEVAPGRWAYAISGIYQEWKPGVEGFEPMTEQEATDFVLKEKYRLENGV